MKISIITATNNSALTIEDCITSVNNQSYQDIEHIIIDNASNDGTIDIIKSKPNRVKRIVSEPDNGIYNAMNKGIKLATGDIIGILNSDDFFPNKEIVEKIASAFHDISVNSIYGDVQFINSYDKNKIIRYYSSKNFTVQKFKFGFMPAHPSFYVKRDFFDLLGYYKEEYRIAADFELLVRFLYVNKLKSSYIEMPFVSMRPGGISNRSFKNVLILNNEIIRACKENGIESNLFYIYSKYFNKIREFFGNKYNRANSIRIN
jgi:glycosyltransferase involved in cell wall biosynthesis